jgi:hypothetical protein
MILANGWALYRSNASMDDRVRHADGERVFSGRSRSDSDLPRDYFGAHCHLAVAKGLSLCHCARFYHSDRDHALHGRSDKAVSSCPYRPDRWWLCCYRVGGFFDEVRTALSLQCPAA